MHVELFFDSGTARLHNGVGTVNTTESGGAARDWFGVGDLGDIKAITEGSDLETGTVELYLSGLDSQITDEAMNQQPRGRLMRLFLQAYTESDQKDGLLSPIWRGRMDKMRVALGDTENTVILTCESYLTRLRRARQAYFTDTLQQKRFADDRGFQYVPELQFATVIWAGKSVKNTRPNDRSLRSIAASRFLK